MKRFITNILIFSGLLFMVILLGFLLPVTPRASESLLYAKVDKDRLLNDTNGPRIILVGGSNLSFGIDSKTIQDSLQLNPINTGVHAFIGLDYMMDNTIKYVKEGDVIILAPEYLQFYGSMVYGGEELLRTVADLGFSKIGDLNKNQLKNVSKFLLKYSFSKFKPTEYFGFEESDVYSVNSFNQYGDVFTHWVMEQRDFRPYETIKSDYNPHTIELMSDFRTAVEKKGASLFVTFPGYQASSYENNIANIKRVEKELIAHKFKLLGTPERYKIPDEMMFNTPYHLLKIGVDYRTKSLIEDFKKAQSTLKR